jgi:hypothetical protein
MCNPVTIKYEDCILTIIEGSREITLCPDRIEKFGNSITFYQNGLRETIQFNTIVTPLNCDDYYAELMSKFRLCKNTASVTPPTLAHAKGDFMIELCGISSDVLMDRDQILAMAITNGAVLSDGSVPTKIVGYDLDVYYKGDEVDGFTTTKQQVNFIQGTENTKLKGGENRNTCGEKCPDGSITMVSDFSIEIKQGSCIRLNLDLQ